ncbi:MAG: hypothetical protein U0931_42385 [Vulcanimicrobiota bacterium]
MEIRSLNTVREQPGAQAASAPARDRSHLSERFTQSTESENAWRDQAQQLNQLAQMARLRGYR